MYMVSDWLIVNLDTVINSIIGMQCWKLNFDSTHNLGR